MENGQTFLIKNEHDLESLAKNILEKVSSLGETNKTATVLALKGDLGAGKTTFTKSLARILGITESVTSPTFVIQKTFEIDGKKFGHFVQNNDSKTLPFKKLIHIDSYRLDLSSELEHLGWHDLLNHRDNLIVVEWPERVQDILPDQYILLEFEHVDETIRKVIFHEIKN